MPRDLQLNEETTFRVPDDVLARRAAGETVLLNLADEQYYGLDEVGGRAWELIDSGRSFGEITDVMLDEYDVDRTVLVHDLTAMVSELVDLGILTTDGP